MNEWRSSPSPFHLPTESIRSSKLATVELARGTGRADISKKLTLSHCHCCPTFFIHSFTQAISIAPLQAGASIPLEAMMHFPPVSDFPSVSEKFSDSVENFQHF